MSLLHDLIWSKLNGGSSPSPSSSDLFVITLTESGGVYSADKTFAEIEAAIDAGKMCIAVTSGGYYYLESFDGVDALFISANITGNVATIDIFDIDSDDTVTKNTFKAQQEQFRVKDTTSTSITLASAAANTIYTYGELTALTVTAIAASGDFIIRFTSGSTPTTTNFPASMKFAEAFAAEANTRYEINVSDGYALVASWPTT